MKKDLNELEISMFTLWSLFVLADQHFVALLRYSKILEEEYELNNDDEISLSTIREALVYQVFLKTCSFIDEWDQILGARTEAKYKETVMTVKRIVKHHRKVLNSWKGLREFRNNAIAHNHRDKKGQNIYYSNASYHTPHTIPELALMIYCMEKMAKTLGALFPKEYFSIISATKENLDSRVISDSKAYTLNEIREHIYSLEQLIEDEFTTCSNIKNVTSNYAQIILDMSHNTISIL
ncbi:MAG: hypothetical protein EOP56_07265 [Sphingobacteriales bacterium]|nr:MAG: hypothetical protein EOP56_07265 [Sphingobacteriales bacterium]